MATVTDVVLSCDVCGNAKDVQTWTFGLDGKTYEIDLCPKDGKDLGKVAAGYVSKARQAGARQGHRRGGRTRRSRATEAKADRSQPRKAKPAPKQTAKPAPKQTAETAGVQEKGIYVYGILPADIEVAGDQPGVGEHPGPLRAVCSDGLAALVSEVDMAGRRGSPDDLRTHREILNATASEVPVLPLRFGTVLTSEDAVVEELLTAHHDEFDAALKQLEGCAEFVVKGRYAEAAVQGEDVAARREEDTRALEQAMEGICVASVVRHPAHELDAVHVAFLVAADEESDMDRVIEDLAREWEGRIDVQLLGPMAAYDFAGTAEPGG
jgi:hypothetical protein